MLLSRFCVGALGACIMLPSISLNAQGTGENRPALALRAARLIDGKSETVVKDAVVLVSGEKIAAVGAGLPIPANTRVID